MVVTPSKDHSASREEVERVITQMLIQDPFLVNFLSGSVRQVTDTIPTAGVCAYKQHVALLVNPTFFMEVLPDLAERAGVLKHEALHIMLKHIFQMRDPKITNKYLYNIAADIEVNQYIGHPWRLPDSAITLETFPDFDLPANDVALSYYNILLLEKLTKIEQKMGKGQGQGQGQQKERRKERQKAEERMG